MVWRMRRMQAVYYRDPDGVESVRAWLDQLDVQARVAVARQMRKLNDLLENEPPLPFPHASQVRGELRELRCHCGRRLYRILYRRSGSLFVLLHGFAKHTDALPEAEIAVASSRWDDFRARMDDALRLRRPAGRDAP